MVYLFYLRDIERAVPNIEWLIRLIGQDVSNFEKTEILHNGWIHYESKEQDWLLIEPEKWSGTDDDLIRLITNNRPIVIFTNSDRLRELTHLLIINNLTIHVNDYDNIMEIPTSKRNNN